MANPFDYLVSINQTKKNLMKGTENDALAEKGYNAFLTNRGLSYFPDTIFAANMMNCNHALDNKMQYMFYINIIRQRKRFSKWVKKQPDDDIEAVMEYYDYNHRNAKSALKLLSSAQVLIIKNILDKGGTK